MRSAPPVAAIKGCVQVGDGIRHAQNMRCGSVEREENSRMGGLRLVRCRCEHDENYQASVAIVSDAVRHSLRSNEHQSRFHLDFTIF